MPCHCSTSHPFIVVGSTEQIRDALCGPQDHNEHCKGWRWHLYVQDDAKRMANVMAELHQMHAERREYTRQQQADIDLAHWQTLRALPPDERVELISEARNLVFG
jgi:hypothetical protein